MRVAVFGGSFDPPHVAHQAAVQMVIARDDIDRVLVVPVYDHAFDKSLAPFEHRVRMCQLCLTGQKDVEVSRLEASLGHPNYTLHTLQALRSRHPDYELRLVVGGDVLLDSEKWHRFEEVRQLAPLLMLGRVGAPCALAPAPVLPQVSSTEIRQLLRGRPPGPVLAPLKAALLHYLPGEVLAYIEQHDLYRH